MKILFKTLASAAVISALAACGSGDSDSTEILVPTTISGPDVVATPTLADDQITDTEQSISLMGAPQDNALHDLSIANASAEIGARSISYEFDVANNSVASVDLENLSIALEVAASGSFSDSYRLPLYDIRESDTQTNDGYLSLSARSSETDLPAGSYLARLVVNPNWQYSFDTVPQGENDSQPFRYIEERDYQNNASGAFQIEASSATVCEEDGFEDNDTVGSATLIPAGGQLMASLCLDDVDFYAVILADGERTSLTFDYTDSQTNPNAATRYVVLDSNFNRTTQPSVARDSNKITITAGNSGQYYLAFFGQRSSYRISRFDGQGFQNDESASIFHQETIAGPDSWLYGGVTLNRLAFSEALLNDQVVNCGRIATQFSNDQPVAYVTPSHFADIHEFRFLDGGGYLVDGERHNGWHVQDGDISHAAWYANSYAGYAEKVSDNSWRYWSDDGLAYVECVLEVSQ